MSSRRYFSDVALPELYSVVYVHIEKLLADATSVSFTIDIWTSSVSPVSVLSLTAHWIDQDLNFPHLWQQINGEFLKIWSHYLHPLNSWPEI